VLSAICPEFKITHLNERIGLISPVEAAISEHEPIMSAYYGDRSLDICEVIRNRRDIASVGDQGDVAVGTD